MRCQAAPAAAAVAGGGFKSIEAGINVGYSEV
jgi:hypothetical protein